MSNHEQSPQDAGNFAEGVVKKGLSIQTSRRGFLQGVGLALGGLAAGAALKPFGAQAAGSIEAGAVEGDPLAQGSWDTLPVVVGETALTTEGEISNHLVTNPEEANRREGPGKDFKATLMPAGSIFELTETPDIQDWNQVNTIYDAKQGLDPQQTAGYMAGSVLQEVTDTQTLPPEVLAALAPKTEFVLNPEQYDIAQLADLGKNVGGKEIDLSKIWGDQVSTTDKTIAAWQKTVGMAFIEAETNPSLLEMNACGVYDMGSCKSALHKTAGGATEVITRITNSGASANSDIFVISRTAASGGLNVGFSTVEGLQSAYGEEAAIIAATATGLSGSEAEKLAVSIANLDSTKVFLPGMSEFHQFADKATLHPVDSKNKEITGAVSYVKAGDNYRAELHDETGQIRGFAQYVEATNGWVEVTEKDIFYMSKLFAEATGLTADDVMKNGSMESVPVGQSGENATFLTYNGVPVMVTKEGEPWKQVTTRTLFEYLGVDFGTSVDGAEDYKNYQRSAGQFFSMMKATGFDYEMITGQMPFRWNQMATQQKMGLYPGAIFYHGDVDPAIKGKNLSQELVGKSMDSRAKAVLEQIDKAGGKGVVDVLSEAMWWSNGPGWENSEYYQAFGRDVIAEAYVRTYEQAVKLGLDVGGDLKLIYNEYGIEVQGPKADFVYGELQHTKEVIAQRLGIPMDEVKLGIGMQYHIIEDPSQNGNIAVGGTNSDKISFEAVKANIKRFAQIGPVHITELELNFNNDPQKAQEMIDLVIDAALSTGDVESITLYEALRFKDLWHAVNAGLFEDRTYKPTSALYDIQKIAYDHLKAKQNVQ